MTFLSVKEKIPERPAEDASASSKSLGSRLELPRTSNGYGIFRKISRRVSKRIGWHVPEVLRRACRSAGVPKLSLNDQRQDGCGFAAVYHAMVTNEWSANNLTLGETTA